MSITKEQFCRETGIKEDCVLFEHDNGKWQFDFNETTKIYTFNNGRTDYQYQIKSGRLFVFLDWLNKWIPVGDEMIKEAFTNALGELF